MSRTISLKGAVFAENGITVIPQVPQTGITYRDETYDAPRVANGWPFYQICNSAEFNQIMFQVTGLLNEIERFGILTWSELTDYPIGGICRDPDDGVYYECIAPSGPNTGGTKQPSLNIGTFWKSAFSGGGYEVRFVAGNAQAQINELLYCQNGALSIALPSAGLVGGEKVKVCTSQLVNATGIVTVTGPIGVDSSLIIDTPNSSVELVFDGAASVWRIASANTPIILD